ncbi:MAG TPA: DUF881 domain-containing protein [Bacillota bacterium]|nr:DUF881 domain-containing protein [Bacillota bacterium]
MRRSVPIAIVTVFLGILLATQFRTTRQLQSNMENSSNRFKSMLTVLDKAKDKQTKETDQVNRLRVQLEEIKNGRATGGKDSELRQEINRVKLLTGELPVTGPGLVIHLDDREATATQIFSGDIKDIINILRYAGAEAISINGQRVVANTAVHEAGRNLLVNKVPINQREGIPYEFLAIGDRDRMESFVRTTYGLLNDLEASGVKIEIRKLGRVEIPSFKGSIEFVTGH